MALFRCGGGSQGVTKATLYKKGNAGSGSTFFTATEAGLYMVYGTDRNTSTGGLSITTTGNAIVDGVEIDISTNVASRTKGMLIDMAVGDTITWGGADYNWYNYAIYKLE